MRALIVTALLWGALSVSRPVRAEPGGRTQTNQPSAAQLAAAPGTYVHTFGAASYGRGLRFNNPFRLQNELGHDEKSLSLTAGYLDLSAGATLGAPSGFQQGAVAHLSIATDGIQQQVLSLSYLAELAAGRDAWIFARLGIPVVLGPERTAGVELGAGTTYLLTGALGLTAELDFGVYQGAATWEHDPTLWPVLSFQLGASFDYEVLP